MMNTAEERKEFADAMNQAVNDWSKLVVMPVAAMIVLSCVFV